MTNNLHPDHMDMQDVIELYLHAPPLLWMWQQLFMVIPWLIIFLSYLDINQ